MWASAESDFDVQSELARGGGAALVLTEITLGLILAFCVTPVVCDNLILLRS